MGETDRPREEIALRARLPTLLLPFVRGVLALALAILADDIAYSQINETCTWRGTAPFCEGHCEEGELTRGASSDGENTPDFPGFGATCITGVKSYCCKPLFPNESGGPPPSSPEPPATRQGGKIIVAPGPIEGTELNKGPIVEPGEKPTPVAVSFEGRWSAVADNVAYDILMSQTGNTVVGNFVGADGSRGTFSGALSGLVLRFAWSQIDGARGSGKFSLSANGQSFAGSYNFGQDPDEVGGTWNGSRR